MESANSKVVEKTGLSELALLPAANEAAPMSIIQDVIVQMVNPVPGTLSQFVKYRGRIIDFAHNVKLTYGELLMAKHYFNTVRNSEWYAKLLEDSKKKNSNIDINADNCCLLSGCLVLAYKMSLEDNWIEDTPILKHISCYVNIDTKILLVCEERILSILIKANALCPATEYINSEVEKMTASQH
jgi:hypothetical protein